jgi:hypothetical protein
MFEDVAGVRDRLAVLVDRLDPDAVSGSPARRSWAEFDRVERLAAAGKDGFSSPDRGDASARPVGQ